MTGALSFANAKPGLIRALIAERTDPVLFAHVLRLRRRPFRNGRADVAGTGNGDAINHPPSLSEVVETLLSAGKLDLPAISPIGSTGSTRPGAGRCLKLITGALRIGVSARLAKTAVAALGDLRAERRRGSLARARAALSRSLRLGRGAARQAGIRSDPAPFRTPMLAHAIDEADFAALAAGRFFGRMEMGRHPRAGGDRASMRRASASTRLYSRTGENVSAAFPDLLDALDRRDFRRLRDRRRIAGRARGPRAAFRVLQQRLNRKTVSAKLIAEYPAHIRAYDLLAEDGEDLRPLPFDERRARLERIRRAARQSAHRSVAARAFRRRLDELAALRARPASSPAPCRCRRRSKA